MTDEATPVRLPRRRLRCPPKSVLSEGDLVQVTAGSLRGAVGVVVIERNGNYADRTYQRGIEDCAVTFQTASALDGPHGDEVHWFSYPYPLERVVSRVC